MVNLICACGETDQREFYKLKKLKKGKKRRCITCTLKLAKDPDLKKYGAARELRKLERTFWLPTTALI